MSLTAASADRKARLAQLKSLKRKAPSESDPEAPSTTLPDAPLPSEPSDSALPLSGRTYDPLLRGPKLGFSQPPSSGTDTAEARAQTLADAAILAAAEQADKPVDLFSLRPKAANADLKRELERRMEGSGLNGRTERAIAEIVRARISARASGDGEGGGGELVEATREREKEDEEERERERGLEEELVAV